MRLIPHLILTCLLVGPALAAGGAFDERTAMKTLKQNKCFNCHSVTREKDGPSYQKVAADLKDHPDPKGKLYTHLTTSPTITVDGKTETHTSLKTTDNAEIMNLVEWILSN
ncbi:MAG TPA: c-type cytochrome [Gammaproteobacteria bacterium]